MTEHDREPRGHQRSDERLREMICERLMEEHSLDVSDVEVSVRGGRVTLDGSIDSRLAKYQVEDIVDHVGVSDVQNNLRVSGDEPKPGLGGERSSQSGSSGGVSSLGMSGSGMAGVDRTATGATNSTNSTKSTKSGDSKSPSPQ